MCLRVCSASIIQLSGLLEKKLYGCFSKKQGHRGTPLETLFDSLPQGKPTSHTNQYLLECNGIIVLKSQIISSNFMLETFKTNPEEVKAMY